MRLLVLAVAYALRGLHPQGVAGAIRRKSTAAGSQPNAARQAVAVPPKPLLPGEVPTVPWTEAEIAAAKATCKELLTGDPLDYDELPPIKEGLCGAPAPVLLRVDRHRSESRDRSAGDTQLSDGGRAGRMAARYRAARRPRRCSAVAVVKIHNATSYACRNRYGGGRDAD